MPRFEEVCLFSQCANLGTVLGSPLSDQFPTRALEAYSGSTNSLDLVASWLKDCTSNHKNCTEGHNSSLPTRILDIGTEGTAVKLLDGHHRRGSYICLSYCVSTATGPVDTERQRRKCSNIDQLAFFVSGAFKSRTRQQKQPWISDDPDAISPRCLRPSLMPSLWLVAWESDICGLIVFASSKMMQTTGRESLPACAISIPMLIWS